ncbi:ribonuclease G [Nonlabens sp. MIC269]|uniref:Rne/Rng family ribonuclease n=1 Tax=Nonlabens TaxID=363408 RepID=UPI0007227A6C|nr:MULTISPECIES: ribonuclease E/G [Nonlabens]ALM21173.1 ribonuclease G [Nonlabens sp. MIC269]ARN72105.1 ribonuclease E/G [Nonlabens tegetincola]MEE2801069.1 ribonuclease E/G [Bacteroidota bacterium]
MDKEIIIRSGATKVDYALTKNGRLIELHKDEDENKFAVSDVFIAKARKVLSGLNASFVNVGYEKDGFLHYHDLGPKYRTQLKFTKQILSGRRKNFKLKDIKLEKELDKSGSIDDVVESGQPILVQVVKEPISTKGPRLSAEISLPGRYVVLVPFSDRISISQKIEDREEKSRLKRLVKSIKPEGFGVIVRTVATGKLVADLDQDLQNLMEKWDRMCSKLHKASFPTKVLTEQSRTHSLMRDVFNDTYTSIIVDDKEVCEEIKEYLSTIAPHKQSIVKYHNPRLPIFEKYGIERQIKTSFGKTVSMSKGAYLVIEHTEAMHVIDVNSGNRSNKADSQEDTALETNLIAATEIARQLRLRDMGGIIVVDFIDMRASENRKKLYEHLREEMSDDRAKHKILPPSKFGLIQITRQRVRQEVKIKTREENPNGNGNEIQAPIVIVQQITEKLERLFKEGNKNITLNAHPFIAAFLTKGVPSIRSKWFMKHKKWVKILPRDAYTYLEYKFKDKDGKVL